MKKLTLSILAAASLAAAVPAVASAAPWMSINQREAQLNQRIAMGQRNGALTAREATQLRADLRSLERLEANYRRSRPGLTMSERADLDRRFDALSARVRFERHDNDRRGDWHRDRRGY